jgi:hypothetical protein
MRTAHIGYALALALGVVGCQGAPGSGERGGYVLLDAEARAAGFTVEVSGEHHASALPYELSAEDDDATLVGPHGKMAIAGAAGELLRVRGRLGELESLDIDADVSPDLVRVRGTEEAATALAELLGAESVAVDGGWELRATDVLTAAALVGAPQGLEEVSPVPMDASELDEELAHAAVGAAQTAARAPGAFTHVLERMRAAELEMASYALPAAVNCNDPVAGVWVSQQYDTRYRDWYIFTLRIARGAGDTLQGHIEAHSWDTGDAKAPASCDGGSHWKVGMPASGKIEGGTVRFGGTSWNLKQALCGSAPGPGMYNLDHFTGTLDGARFLSLNNDGGRMLDEPTPFRRIACNAR